MATPITWRTLNSRQPNVTGLMYGAQQGADRAFQSFDRVLQREQQTRSDNRENTINNNTQAFMDELAQYRSPEELEAARARGEFQQLREGYGNMIDRNATRDAPAARLNELRNRATQDYQYDQTQRQREEAPLVAQAKTLIANGDIESFRRFQQENPNLQAMPELATAAQTAEREGYKWNRTQEQNAITDGISTTVNNTVLDYDATRQEQESAIRSIYADSGYVNENGEVDFSNASAGDLDRLEQRLAQNGLDSPLSSTQAAHKAVQDFRGRFPNASPEQVQRVRDGIFAETLAMSGLSPEDQGKIKTRWEKAKQDLNSAGNPYVREEGWEPNQASNEVIDYAIDNNGEHVKAAFGNGDFKEDVRKEILEAIDPQGGVPLLDDNGIVVERVPLTPEMVKGVMRDIHSDFFEFNQNTKSGFQKRLQEVAESRATKAQYENYAELRSLEGQLAGEAQGAFGPNRGNPEGAWGALDTARMELEEQKARDTAANEAAMRNTKPAAPPRSDYPTGARQLMFGR